LPVMHEQRGAQICRQFHAQRRFRRVDIALRRRRVERFHHRRSFAPEIIAQPLPKIEHESLLRKQHAPRTFACPLRLDNVRPISGRAAPHRLSACEHYTAGPVRCTGLRANVAQTRANP
jgi:hypothetical protein